MSGLSMCAMDSPLGPLELRAGDAGLVGIYFDDHRYAPTGEAHAKPDHPALQSAVRQLAEFFAGTRRIFDLPLAPVGTPFQHRVWALLAEIPFGATTTYGALARRLGAHSSARAVGSAVGRNPLSIVIPCHRVVGQAGQLTGYAGGLPRKAWLLSHEGQPSLGLAL